jgi:hypothetical protein
VWIRIILYLLIQEACSLEKVDNLEYKKEENQGYGPHDEQAGDPGTAEEQGLMPEQQQGGNPKGER